jgi:hypothetical protein
MQNNETEVEAEPQVSLTDFLMGVLIVSLRAAKDEMKPGQALTLRTENLISKMETHCGNSKNYEFAVAVRETSEKNTPEPLVDFINHCPKSGLGVLKDLWRDPKDIRPYQLESASFLSVRSGVSSDFIKEAIAILKVPR